MTTGHVLPTPRPLALAVALVAAFAAVMLTTGVTRAAVWSLTADLTAAAEVPTPGPEGATGSALIVIDDETNEVCFELTIDGLEEGDAVIMAHIHTGAAGVAGGVVVPLFTEPPTAEMTGCVPGVDPATIAAITSDPAAGGQAVPVPEVPAAPGEAVRRPSPLRPGDASLALQSVLGPHRPRHPAPDEQERGGMKAGPIARVVAVLLLLAGLIAAAPDHTPEAEIRRLVVELSEARDTIAAQARTIELLRGRLENRRIESSPGRDKYR